MVSNEDLVRGLTLKEFSGSDLESKLILEARNGSREALGILAEKMNNVIVKNAKIAKRKKIWSYEIDDLISEATFPLMNAVRDYNGWGNFIPYFSLKLRSHYNWLARDAHRQKRNETRVIENSEENGFPLDNAKDYRGETNPSEIAAKKDLYKVAMQHVQTLPEAKRKIVEMKLFSSMTNEQVGESLNSTWKFVKSQYQMSLHSLRKSLKPYLAEGHSLVA